MESPSAETRQPLGAGGLLDRSFQLFRQHFGKLFIMVLIFYGPVYLLQSVLLLDMGSLTLLPSFGGSSDFSSFVDSRLFEAGFHDEMSNVEMSELLLVLGLLMPLYFLTIVPLTTVAVIHYLRRVDRQEQASITTSLKKALQNFWPLFGSSFVFYLVLFVIYLGSIAIGIAAVFSSFFLAPFFNPLMESFWIVTALVVAAFVALTVAVMLLFFFFVIRFMFFMPMVAFEGQRLGIKQSWRLTRGHFWRLLLIGIVLTLIYGIITFGLQALLLFLLGMSALGQALQMLASVALTPVLLVTYAVCYSDMKLRHDAEDIEVLLHRSDDEVNGSTIADPT